MTQRGEVLRIASSFWVIRICVELRQIARGYKEQGANVGGEKNDE